MKKLFPVQSKSYSGFFKGSTNSFPFGLVLDDSYIALTLFGFIPYVKVNLSDIVSFVATGDTWVMTQKVFNGVVVKYAIGGHKKERVFSFFSEAKSLEFVKYLREKMGSLESKV